MEIKRSNIKLYSAFIVLLFASRYDCAPAYSTALETALRTELFVNKSYEVLQRPEKKNIIGITLTVLTINGLNIKDQTLSISGYLTAKWRDSRLDWSDKTTTSQDFSNVNFLFSTEVYVWRPALVIENSVKALKIISDITIPMRILSNGQIVWSPSGIYEVSCESDTTYYPLDQQECSLKISSWAYTNSEVSLVFGLEAVSLDYYSENGEWDLISATGSKSEDKSRGGISFSSLTYSLKLQRRPMFHIINTLLPVALMAVLIAMVFKLPVDSGEKIGFSLTVLLAYAVYLTMISDNIPSTSVTICYLSIYLVLILSLGVISVCLTIFVLSLHFQPDDEPIPTWLQTLTHTVLKRIALMKRCGRCFKSSKVSEIPDHLPGKGKSKVSKTSDPIVVAVVEEEDEDNLTWKLLSAIMDKVFFNVYIIIILAATTALAVIECNHYFNSQK